MEWFDEAIRINATSQDDLILRLCEQCPWPRYLSPFVGTNGQSRKKAVSNVDPQRDTNMYFWGLLCSSLQLYVIEFDYHARLPFIFPVNDQLIKKSITNQPDFERTSGSHGATEIDSVKRVKARIRAIWCGGVPPSLT